jgi:uncharacterized protein
MPRTLILTCWFVILGTVSGGSWGASYDCRGRNLSHTEERICADELLSDMDSKLSFIYALVRDITALDKRAQLSETQRHWIAERNQCSDNQCLREAYRARQDELSAAANSLFGAPQSEQIQGPIVATPIANFEDTYPLVGSLAFCPDDATLVTVPLASGGALHVWRWLGYPHILRKLDWPSPYPLGAAIT